MRGVRRSPKDVLMIIAIAVSIITSFGLLQQSQASSAGLQMAFQDKEDAKRSKDTKSTSATATKETHASQKDVATQNSADNTAKNARDKSGDTLTPMDQS